MPPSHLHQWRPISASLSTFRKVVFIGLVRGWVSSLVHVDYLAPLEGCIASGMLEQLEMSHHLLSGGLQQHGVRQWNSLKWRFVWTLEIVSNAKSTRALVSASGVVWGG